MRRPFLSATLLCIAGAFALINPSPGRAQNAAPPPVVASTNKAEPQTTIFSLRWMKPSEFVALLTSPIPPMNQADDTRRDTLYSGLVRISPDDATNRVLVQGSPKAIDQMQQIAQLFDVDPKRVRLTVRILRAPAHQFALFAEPDQKLRKGEVVSTAVAVFKNNEAITLHAVGDGQPFHIPLTPHVNGDGSVSIAVDVSDLPASTFAPVTLSGIKETKEPSGEKRIRVGRVGDGVKLLVANKSYWKDNNFAYYLEITPAVLLKPEQP